MILTNTCHDPNTHMGRPGIFPPANFFPTFSKSSHPPRAKNSIHLPPTFFFFLREREREMRLFGSPPPILEETDNLLLLTIRVSGSASQ